MLFIKCLRLLCGSSSSYCLFFSQSDIRLVTCYLDAISCTSLQQNTLTIRLCFASKCWKFGTDTSLWTLFRNQLFITNGQRSKVCPGLKYALNTFQIHFQGACIYPSLKWNEHTCHDMQKRQVFGPVSFISWIINAVILTEYCFIYYTLHRAQGGEIRGLHLTQKCLCWINITLIYLTKCCKITKIFTIFQEIFTEYFFVYYTLNTATCRYKECIGIIHKYLIRSSIIGID